MICFFFSVIGILHCFWLCWSWFDISRGGICHHHGHGLQAHPGHFHAQIHLLTSHYLKRVLISYQLYLNEYEPILKCPFAMRSWKINWELTNTVKAVENDHAHFLIQDRNQVLTRDARPDLHLLHSHPNRALLRTDYGSQSSLSILSTQTTYSNPRADAINKI